MTLNPAVRLLVRSYVLLFKMASCRAIQKSAISLRHYILNLFCVTSIFPDYELGFKLETLPANASSFSPTKSVKLIPLF